MVNILSLEIVDHVFCYEWRAALFMIAARQFIFGGGVNKLSRSPVARRAKK